MSAQQHAVSARRCSIGEGLHANLRLSRTLLLCFQRRLVLTGIPQLELICLGKSMAEATRTFGLLLCTLSGHENSRKP